MIPGIFKNISQSNHKLKCLDKFNIPIETIDIIKSFIFYKIYSHPYYKIISKTNVLLLDKFTRIKYIPGISNGHWAVGFIINDNPITYSKVHGENCVFCGEYLYAGWRSYIKYNLSLPPTHTVPYCRCS